MAALDETVPERDRNEIKAVLRALNLVEQLGLQPGGLRLSELARRCGLSLSTAHRLLGTLKNRGFVECAADGVTWQVGQAAFIVGSAFSQDGNFVAAALPHLRHLRDITKETANLGILSDGFVTVLAQVESRQITRAITRVGGHVPASVSAMGKALLASYADQDIEAMVERHGLIRPTRAAPGRLSNLMERVEDVRRNGYAVDDQEAAPGIRCVAAAVYDQSGEPVCAISISGLTDRVTMDRMSQISAMVIGAADRLTSDLGGQRPSASA